MEHASFFERVVSGGYSTADSAWHCAAAIPRSALARWVPCISELDGVGPAVMERELPRGEISVFVDLASERRLLDPRAMHGRRLAGAAWVSGPHYRSILTSTAARSWFCSAQLTPEGAYRILRVSPGELVNRVVPLDEVLGACAQQMVAQLLDAQHREQRLEILGSFLITRALGRERWDPVVSHVLGRINHGPPAINVASLAQEVGWSRKHLHRRLTDFTGLGPSRWRQIQRFRAALIMLSEGSAVGLAHVAHALDYTDQAHFSREFRELADMTPTEYLHSRAFNLDWGYARVDRSH